MKKIMLVAAGLVLLLFVSGCAPKVLKPPPAMPALAPEEILSKISERVPEDVMLRARARFSVDSPKGKFATRVALLARRPHFLRIESISLLGLPDLILTSNGSELKIFAVKEGKFYVGPARENLSRYFPIHLDAEEAVRLILGLPPGVQGMTTALKGSMDGDFYRMDLFSGGMRIQTLWLDPSDLTLRRIEKLEHGERIYRAEMGDYGKTGVPVPGRMEIQFDRPEKTSVSLRYPDRELDRAESAAERDDFDLEPPPGIAPIFLDPKNKE